MLTPWMLLLYPLVINLSYHVITASLCLGGSDISATVRENSPLGEFIANISIFRDPGANSIRLCLTGESADWLYLEGQTIRLNSSFSKPLDREALGSILMAVLTCYEEGIMQSQYRVMVEILNENDNRPKFVPRTIQPFSISELTVVNSLAFTVKAIDADGDTLTYVIDQSSPDASYFRIDLPNSGKVVLDKPLDYETKSQLQLVIYAVETNTREKYNATATLTISVRDGDDQYPQFVPCTLVPQDRNLTVCTNPVYTANITESDQSMTLEFSPGPIHAEDGDRSLDTPLQYTILSGADEGRFVIDSRTGAITLTRRVENRQLTPTFRMRIMVSQVNDPKKYSVTTAVVRVRAKNHFPPLFNQNIYKGFVVESSSPVSLISSYGNQALLISATDKDFKDGVNPEIRYSLLSRPTRDGLFHITQEGILIAKADRLRAFDRHILEVVAMDEESGEVVRASVDVEVLPRGQSVPQGPFGEAPLFGDMDVGIAGGIAGVILVVLVAALLLLLRLVRRRRERMDEGGDAISQNTIMVNSSLTEGVSYHNEAFLGDHPGTCMPGRYTTKRDELAPLPQRPYGGEQGAPASAPAPTPAPAPRPSATQIPFFVVTPDPPAQTLYPVSHV